MPTAAQVDELKEVFPSWDEAALLDVLQMTKGDLDEAVDILLAWSAEDTTSGGSKRGAPSRPVGGRSPAAVSGDDAPADCAPPPVVQRREYDCVMAARLQRKATPANLIATVFQHLQNANLQKG